MLRPMLGEDATILPTGSRLFREQRNLGMASIRSVWTRYIAPYNKFILPGVTKAARSYRPDVLVVDQHAAAGAIVAHREGLPWATLVCSAMELTEPFRAWPKITEWTTGHLRTLWSTAGLSPTDYFDLRYSPFLVIAQTTPELLGRADFPPHFRFVGPLLGRRPPVPFPFDALDPDRRHVLVTVGTLSEELATVFYQRAMAAFDDTMQGIVVAEDLTDAPDNVIVVPRVPMPQVLPHMDAVVCHGGLNTTIEALASGVPLVIAPMRNDQPETARQVVEAGAGLRVNFRRATTKHIATAVTAVLDEPDYRKAAHRIAESFRAAGGAAEAAACVARLQQTVADRRRSLSGA
jgi:UDP:flavonoid glycosyltransferase YjiC (YdhE family)